MGGESRGGGGLGVVGVMGHGVKGVVGVKEVGVGGWGSSNGRSQDGGR